MGPRSRPFECQKCGIRFKSATVLKDHLKFDCGTMVERICCIECYRSYHSMSKYIEHFKKFHHQMKFAWDNKMKRIYREYVCFWRVDNKISFDLYYAKRPTDRRRWTLKDSERITEDLFRSSLVFNADLLPKPELPDKMMVRIPFPRIKNRNSKYPEWEAFRYQSYHGTLLDVFAIYSHIMHDCQLAATVCCLKIDKINSKFPQPKYFCALAMFPEPKKKPSKKDQKKEPVTSSSDEESWESDSSEQDESSDQDPETEERSYARGATNKQQSCIVECLAEETEKYEKSLFMIDARVNQDLTKFEYAFIIVHARRHIYLLVYSLSTKSVIVFDSFEEWVSEQDRYFHIKKIAGFIYKTKVTKIKIDNRAKDLLPRAGDCTFFIYKFICNFIDGSDPVKEMEEEEMAKFKKTYFVTSLETTDIGRRLLSILDKYIYVKAK